MLVTARDGKVTVIGVQTFETPQQAFEFGQRVQDAAWKAANQRIAAGAEWGWHPDAPVLPFEREREQRRAAIEAEPNAGWPPQ